MVNVAGRSKSCSTCRRRRVKCDETAPSCNRCLRAGLVCDGPRGTTFINATIARSPEAEASSPGLNQQNALVLQRSTDHSPSPRPSLQIDNDDLFVNYARKYFRPGASIDLALNRIRRDQDVVTHRSLAIQNFEHAILCFSTIMFGVDHSQQAIRQNGYVQHGSTLAKLNQALSDPDYRMSDEALLTVIVLSLLEGLEPTSPGSYLNHMTALERLLQLRETSSSITQQTVKIGQGCRHMLVFAALRTRKATILSQPLWKSILRMNCRPEDTGEQDLFDILADCSSLLERSDQLASMVGTAASIDDLSRVLLREALSRLNSLGCISQRRYAETADDSWLVMGYQQLDLIGDWLQPLASDQSSEFVSEAAATELLLYHTAMIWVFRVISNILVKGSTPSLAAESHFAFESAVLGRESCRAAERMAAEAICSCALRHLSTGLDRYMSASPIVHWAVTTAWETLEPDGGASQQIFNQLLGSRSAPLIARGLLLP